MVLTGDQPKTDDVWQALVPGGGRESRFGWLIDVPPEEGWEKAAEQQFDELGENQ